jgi:putative ABC transport system substrate-binding protein
MATDIGRRQFISALGGAVTCPLAARAQQGERIRRIGVLFANYAESDPEGQGLVTAFVQGLKSLGWIVGKNVQIDLRWAGGEANQVLKLAKELVELRPDVLLGQSSGTAALYQVTQTIPIIFVQVSDPIGRGFVASLARPGRTMTGFSNFEASMSGKWLEVLKEILPNLTRVVFLFSPKASPHIAQGFYIRDAEDAGRRLELHAISAPVQSETEMVNALEAFGSEPNGAAVVLPDSFNTAHSDQIIALMAKLALPAIYSFRSYAEGGGLLSYGIDPKYQYAAAASYVDRILKGEKPGDLPVQAPTKFELVINLKTANALGITVPPNMLTLADEVIE